MPAILKPGDSPPPRNFEEASQDQALQACVQCGSCLETCPVYQAERREDFSPRGKLRILGGWRQGLLKPGPRLAAGLAPCLLCGRCTQVCPNQAQTQEALQAARSSLGRLGMLPALPVMLARYALANPRNLRLLARLGFLAGRAGSGLAWRLAPRLGLAGAARLPAPAARPFLSGLPSLIPGPKGGPRAAFFVGCLANHMRVGLAERAIRLLSRHCTVLLPEQGCCGLPALSAGHTDLARNLARRAVRALARSKPDLVLTTCATCAYSLVKEAPRLLEGQPEAADLAAKTWEISRWLAENRAWTRHWRALPAEKTAWHNPCHARLGLGMSDEAPSLLRAAGLEVSSWPEEEACCGGGALLSLTRPGLSRRIISPQSAALSAGGFSHLATTCSGCFLQWQTAWPGQVCHPLELLQEK